MFRVVVPRLCQVSHRGCNTVPRYIRKMCSKRYVPVFTPWRSRKHREIDHFMKDFVTRSPFRAFDDGMRDVLDRMERMWPFYEHGPHYDRPRRGEGISPEALELKYDHKTFEVKIDASHFDPDELTVKIQGDRLFIKGKHEQKADEHGYVSREFAREFVIPEDINMDTMSSRFTDEGMIIVRAKVKEVDEYKGRVINVERDSEEEVKSRFF